MSEPTGPTPGQSYGHTTTAPAAAPLSPADEPTWGLIAHLSSFVAAWFALGFVGPLIVMLVFGPRSAFVRRHAVEALNFNLSVLIYVAVTGLLSIVLIGIPFLVATGLLYVVATVLGALAASRGEDFRYPLTIRFVS